MEMMKSHLGVIFPGLIMICLHGIFAIEQVDYNVATQHKEQEMDKRILDSISAHGLNGFDKRRFDSIADSRGFSGFTSKRLYDDEPDNIEKRPFDSINYGSFRGFVKRRMAEIQNEKRLNWFAQRPISLVGGIGPVGYEKRPVDAIYVGGLNRLDNMPRESRYMGSPNRWYNLMSNIRLSRFSKRADEVVDSEIPEYRP